SRCRWAYYHATRHRRGRKPMWKLRLSSCFKFTMHGAVMHHLPPQATTANMRLTYSVLRFIIHYSAFIVTPPPVSFVPPLDLNRTMRNNLRHVSSRPLES